MAALKFYCQQINNTEWSGIVFYTRKGNTILVKDFLLMSIDSVALTEFQWNDSDNQSKIIDYMTVNDLFTCSMGTLHSHYSMGVTPSTTDWEDIARQTPSYTDGYLFMIINNRNEFTCIYSVNATEVSSASYKSLSGKVITDTVERPVVYHHTCIQYTETMYIEDKYIEVLDKVIEETKVKIASKKAVTTVTKYNPSQTGKKAATDDKYEYNLFLEMIKGYVTYNSNIWPEKYLEMYKVHYGYIAWDEEEQIIKDLLKTIKQNKKTPLINALINDYQQWLQIRKKNTTTDTKEPYGQTTAGQSWSWD